MTVQKVVHRYALKFVAIAGGIFVAACIVLGFTAIDTLGIFCIAYLVSFIFTGSNFFVMRRINVSDNSRFFKIFGWSLAARFLLVLAAIFFVLKLINSHQIFFTVSFIISYICHSVIEIIFFNKILETDTKL